MSNFKVAGVSKFKGEFKVRFANDLTRVKLLTKSGNTDINLVDLPKAMSKSAAVTYLKNSDLYKVPAQAAAIDAADAKYNAKATVKVTKTKTVAKAKTKAPAPSIAAIKARKPGVKVPQAATAPAGEVVENATVVSVETVTE